MPGYPNFPKTRFLFWDIPLQVFCFGLSRVIPGYTPSRDIPGYPGITLHVVFPDETTERSKRRSDLNDGAIQTKGRSK